MPNIDLSILNQRQTPAFYADVLANRPAAGFIGRIFVSTNTYAFYRDNGTGWDLIGGPGTGTVTGSGTAGQVTYWDGASSITGSNNLFFDTANNRLGVNTNTPGASIDVHSAVSSIAQFNQTTATNNSLLVLQNSGSALWRLGNYYNAGANDFGVFDVVGAIQPLTIKKTTGQTFIGPETSSSGLFIVNSATSDNHIVAIGANAPSIRVRTSGAAPTYQFGLGLATGTNNFIQGSVNGDFCVFTSGSTISPILFGLNNSGVVNEAARFSISRNFLIGTTTDSGEKLIVNGAGRFNGAVNIFDTTQATSSSTGCLILNGGLGISKNIFSSANILTNTGVIAALNGGSIEVYAAGNSNYFDLKSSGGNFSLRTNLGISAVNALTVTAGGNTLIGTTTDAGYKLDVNGGGRFNATVIIDRSGSSLDINPTTGQPNITLRSGNTFRGYIEGNASGGLSFGAGASANIYFTIKSTGVINIPTIPTSAVGLSSGDIYSNAGILTRVP